MTTHNSRLRTIEQAEAVTSMRANPGAWVPVGTYKTRQSANALSYALRTGRLASFRDRGPFETTSRQDNGEWEVYARYVGEPAEPTVTVTVAQVETALRKYLAHLDYDLHKGIERNEDSGADTYPDEAADLFARLAAAK